MAADCGSNPRGRVVDHDAELSILELLLDLLDDPGLLGVKDAKQHEGHEEVEPEHRCLVVLWTKVLQEKEAGQGRNEHAMNFIPVDLVVVKACGGAVVTDTRTDMVVEPLCGRRNHEHAEEEGKKRSAEHIVEIPVKQHEGEERDE